MQILPQFLQMNRITHLALFSRTFVFLYNYTLQKYIIKGETYLFPLQSLPLSTFKLLNSVRENKKCLLPRDCTATAQPFFCLTHPKSNHQHCKSTWESPSSLPTWAAQVWLSTCSWCKPLLSRALHMSHRPKLTPSLPARPPQKERWGRLWVIMCTWLLALLAKDTWLMTPVPLPKLFTINPSPNK